MTLDEIAAAAELILAQDGEEEKEVGGSESSDEGFGGEVESDIEDPEEEIQKKKVEGLGDSGYGESSVPMETRYASDRYMVCELMTITKSDLQLCSRR